MTKNKEDGQFKPLNIALIVIVEVVILILIGYAVNEIFNIISSV